MWDFLYLLALPALGVAAWLLSARFPAGMRRLVCDTVAVTAVLWAVLVATGLMRQPGDRSALVHRWLGHFLVLVVWYAAPLSAGVVLQQGVRRRPWGSIACVVLV